MEIVSQEGTSKPNMESRKRKSMRLEEKETEKRRNEEQKERGKTEKTRNRGEKRGAKRTQGKGKAYI